MPTSTLASPLSLTELTTGIVAAYVSNNPVPASELPVLIASIQKAIADIISGASSAEVGTAVSGTSAKPSPAEIRKSMQHDGLVSFIDGRTYKTLKRHLTANGLNPRSYCEGYGLPADYPMVAPIYAEKRSALAKAIGLGQPGAMAQRKVHRAA